MNHAEVQESTARGREISLPDPFLYDDVVRGLSSGHHLLHCDHLFALQNGPRVQHHGSSHVHCALYGKKY